MSVMFNVKTLLQYVG